MLAAALLTAAGPAPGRELRRSGLFLRPLLMGDANVAVADEASGLYYNPAALANLVDGSVEAFSPQIFLDETVRLAILDPDSLQDRYQDLDEQAFRDLLGETVYAQFNIRMPVVAVPQKNFAIGLVAEALAYAEVLQNPVLPGLRLEVALDEILFATFAFNLSDHVALGFTPKVVNRVGIDKFFSFGELFVGGDTLDLEDRPEFKQFADGTQYAVPGLDLGLLFRFPFWPGWHPRLGVSMLNIGGYDADEGLLGMEFGERPSPFEPPVAGELRQLNSVGVAVSPMWHGIRYTLALDVVDVTRSALPGPDWARRTKLGLEVGVFPHEDGTALFSLLFGLNATHRSMGFLSRVWIFELGAGVYRVELGENAGDRPDDRSVFIFGFRF